MKLAIDLSFWSLNSAGGIQTVVVNQLIKMAESKRVDFEIVIYCYAEEMSYLRGLGVDFEYYCMGKRRFGLLGRIYREYLVNVLSFYKQSITHVYYFNYFGPVVFLFGMKKAITLHDLNYLDVPNTLGAAGAFIRRVLVTISASSADLVVTVSRFSEERIKQELPVHKTTVIYNSINENIATGDLNSELIDRLGLRRKRFLLFVGSAHDHKNLSLLLDFIAIDPLGRELVIVGMSKRGDARLAEKVRNLSIENKVIFPGYVADDELASLYQMADAFVFPSKYEGFGIPILESMYFGCPVVCSNVTAIPEVGGEAAIYFDPNNLHSLVDAMKNLEVKGVRDSLVLKGYENIKRFSWGTSASKLIEQLKNM